MIKIGLIGYGYWGPNLLRNFHGIDDVDVVAVCDLKPENLKKISKHYGTIKLTNKPEDIFKDSSIDAVSVATPVSTHYSLAREALKNGKHVLVEKPITKSSAEAKELIELAQKENKILMVDHIFIYSPAVQKMRDIIANGELGDIYYFDSVRVNLGLFQHDINVVWDLAPHDISIMDYLLNRRPKSVSAMGSCHVGNGMENIAYLHINYDNNLIAHIHVNWLAPVKIRTTLIGGSKKMIVYDDMETSEKLKVYSKGVIIKNDTEGMYRMLVDYRAGDMYAPKIENKEALKEICKNFVDCINTGNKPITDGEAGLRVVEILEAAQCSIKNGGKPVKI